MIEIFEKEPYLVIKSYENGMDYSEITTAVKNASAEMALAAIEFWSRFIMIETVQMKQDLKLKLFDEVLPFMLQQCKLKQEDYKKFLKDKVDAEVLEKHKEISIMTIRSKAAKAIETIAEKY
jgi:hypothetical protein